MMGSVARKLSVFLRVNNDRNRTDRSRRYEDGWYCRRGQEE